MKFKNLFLILLSTLLLSCDDDDYPYASVPSVVLNQFWTEYPEASDPEFEPSNDAYEIEFEVNDWDHKALIATSGSIIMEKKEISYNDLPQEVRQSLQKNYSKKDIKEVELVKSEEAIYYQLEIKRFLFNDKMVLNEKGLKDSTLNYWK